MQAHYFQLPTAGAEEAIYRERVYCYELYHQLRVLLQGEEDLARYALSGEIDKRGHQIIRPCIPDLVFHAPGRMDNMVVLEVKPINGELKGIQKDLRNLADFVSPQVNYQLGIELAYGDDESHFSHFEREFAQLHDQRLQLFWHRRCGERAIRVL
jgi:hypothetical protein